MSRGCSGDITSQLHVELGKGKSMWPFKRKHDNKELPLGLFDLMESTTGFINSLRAGGGFGYVLFGSGFLLVLCAVFLASWVAQSALPTMIPLGIALISAGAIILVVDRVISYRLAIVKLRMIVDVTQRVVLRAVDSDHPPDSAVIRSLINESLAGVWGLWIPAERGVWETSSPRMPRG